MIFFDNLPKKTKKKEGQIKVNKRNNRNQWVPKFTLQNGVKFAMTKKVRNPIFTKQHRKQRNHSSIFDLARTP